MRLIQLCGIGTLAIVSACSGTVNNYYVNGTGVSGAGASAIGGSGVIAATGGAPSFFNSGGRPATGGITSLGGSGVVAATGGATAMGGQGVTGGATTIGGATGGTIGSSGNSSTGGKGGLSGTGGTSLSIENGIAPLTQQMVDSINNAACVGWVAEAEIAASLLDFVVDTSGAMSDLAPNTSDGRSKWAITSQALQNTFGSLPSSTAVGMLLWPNMATIPNHNTTPIDTSNCVNVGAMVPIATLGPVGSTQRSQLSSALAASTPRGGTPSADGYSYALDHAMVPATLPGVRYMVFITDGQPTIQLGCMGTGQEAYPVDFQPLLDSITGARTSYAVKTFVVGLPGSDNQSSTAADGRGSYSAAARAGGTATANCNDSGPNYCHYDLTRVADFSASITAAFQNIAGNVLSCDFRIANVPSGQIIDPKSLNVIYKINGSSALGDMRLVAPSDSSCPQGNGWYPDPADSTHLILCANTCDLIHNDVGAVLDVRGGCDTLVLTN